MSRHSRKIKSIYDRVKKVPEIEPMPIMVQGEKMSSLLFGVSERINNVRTSRVKTTIEALKASAAASGSYSLSSN